MSRISIDVTPEQHNRLKAVAALAGQSLKEYMLDRTLPTEGDELTAIQELEAFLAPRIEEANAMQFTSQSVDEIAEDVYKKNGLL